jgi:hypothetical protein
MPQVNNRPLGENLPNLVTLLLNTVRTPKINWTRRFGQNSLFGRHVNTHTALLKSGKNIDQKDTK